jgi:hypothetical protein
MTRYDRGPMTPLCRRINAAPFGVTLLWNVASFAE